jgi:hypothetical protein
MAEWHRRLLGLGLPCLLPWVLDVALTLHGQTPEYWAGDYSRATEGAAFYRRLYEFHPAAAVGGHLLFLGLIGALLVLLPEGLAVVLALAAAFGSTWGASSWVERYLVTRAAWGSPAAVSWYQASNALFLATAVLAGVGVRWVVRSSALQSGGGLGRRTSRRPWVLIAVFVAGVAAMVFVPW